MFTDRNVQKAPFQMPFIRFHCTFLYKIFLIYIGLEKIFKKTITMSPTIGTVTPANTSFQSKRPPCALSLYYKAIITIKVAIVEPKAHCQVTG